MKELIISVSPHATEQAVKRGIPRGYTGKRMPKEEYLLLKPEVEQALRSAAIRELERSPEDRTPTPNLGGGAYDALAIIVGSTGGLFSKDLYLIISVDEKYGGDYAVCTCLDEETYLRRKDYAQKAPKKEARVEHKVRAAVEHNALLVMYKDEEYEMEAVGEREVGSFVSALLQKGIERSNIKVYGRREWEATTLVRVR